MSSKNRSYQPGKYGEDHVGKMNNAKKNARRFSSSLRASTRAGEKMKHAENNLNATPLECPITEKPLPPRTVFPAEISDWEDDVSVLTGLSRFPKERGSNRSLSSEPVDGALEQVEEERSTDAEKEFLNGQSMYPELETAPEHSRLASIAFKDFEQRMNSEEDVTEAEALQELFFLSKELNLEETNGKIDPQNLRCQKDQDTGTTEADDSATFDPEKPAMMTKDTHDPKKSTTKKKKDRSKSSSGDKKKKSKKSSKRRKEKATSASATQQQALSSSLRNSLPSNLDDQTLAQLTSAVLEAVSVITSSSKDDKSSASRSSISQQSAGQDDVTEKEQYPQRQQKTKKRKPRTNQSHPSVHFSTVEIRQYERILSDNPSCSSGPSVGIGWQYDEEDTVKTSIDEFEDHRLDSRLPSVPVLNRFDREELLRDLGYSRQDLAVAIRNTNKARNKRRQTVTNLYTQKAEETAESATRFIKKTFRFGGGNKEVELL